jgi:ketosteroid isomerase-like protein
MNTSTDAGAAGASPLPSWCAPLFAAIDARDADAFASFLAADAQFRFGNAPVVAGRAAIRDAVAGFFGAIRACSHRLLGTWQGEGGFVCEGEVTYTRLDGGRVVLPFVNVLVLRGGKISGYRIYIDNGPLFAPSA